MITLKISGKSYDGWKSASVSRAINSLAASFDLTVSEREGEVYIPLGASCQIYVDDTLVITGYIDEVKPSYSASAHEVTFSGRSKSADLVDCSAILDTGQLLGSDLAEAISILTAPFNVPASVPRGSPLPSLQLQQGETVGAIIDKLCAAGGLCYTDSPRGGISIFELQSGAAIANLVHHKMNGGGNNILSGSATYSQRDLFSEYRVITQTEGSDEFEGENLSVDSQLIKDTSIKRYRPLVLSAGQSDGIAAENLAEKEKSTRTGKSLTISYTVQGWKAANTALWEPGKFVNIDDDFIRAKGKMIIESVTYTASEQGTVTALKLTSPAAYIPKSNKPSLVWEELKDGV